MSIILDSRFCPRKVKLLMLQVDSLVQYYKGELGSLPCKLLLAAARQGNTEKDCSSESKHSKYSAKRRKRNIDMEEILIVNREL